MPTLNTGGKEISPWVLALFGFLGFCMLGYIVLVAVYFCLERKAAKLRLAAD